MKKKEAYIEKLSKKFMVGIPTMKSIYEVQANAQSPHGISEWL